MSSQMPRRVTNIRRLLTALLLVAVAAGVLLLTVPSRAQGPRLVLAFYYTWFDENTWTSAKVPDFPAQTYVSRDPGAMDRHIAQAQSAGIDALVESRGPWLRSRCFRRTRCSRRPGRGEGLGRGSGRRAAERQQ